MGTTFGERIRELRLKLDITQRGMARDLEISAASIIAYEKSQKTPSLDVAVKIAEYLGVSLDSLCDTRHASSIGELIRTYGELARTIHGIIKTGCFRIEITKHEREANVFVHQADILTNNGWYKGEFTPLVINDFLVRYGKMVSLLDDGTLTGEIFDTWLESELSNLDEMPLEE